jgi:hypothetical protein
MVGMQVRAYDHVDIVTFEADAGERVDHAIARLHDRRHDLEERPPARLRVGRDVGMAAGIEQHVTLSMAQQDRGHRYVEGFAVRRVRQIDSLAHAHAAAGQDVHLHRVSSALLSMTARIALMMCS